MSNFSQQFSLAIQLKFDLMMNQIFIKHGIASHVDENYVSDANTAAYDMGLNHIFSPVIAAYFEGTPLNEAYLSGHKEREDLFDDRPASGSLQEFNALSDEERSKEWDEFHSLCAQGIAGDMYFYDVMMCQWLVGYVGH